MKIERLVSAGAIVALALGLAASANAEIVTVTFQGVVGSGADQTGVFGVAGANLTGDNYTAVYTIDTSVNAFEDYEPGSLTTLIGGTEYLAVHDGQPAPGEQSPVSATLTINNHTLSVPGAYFGYAWQSVSASGGGEEFEHVEDNTTVGSVTYTDYLANQMRNFLYPVVTSWTFNTTSSYTTQPGDYLYGDFYDYAQNSDGTYLTNVSATLDPTSVTVVPEVPEPATWTLLILGLGMIGFAARRRNEGAALAV